MSRRTADSFAPPAHANAAVHEIIMRELRTATADQIAESAVRAGIYTSDGKLTKHYATKKTR